MNTFKKNVIRVTLLTGVLGFAMLGQAPRKVELSHGSIKAISTAVAQMARLSSTYAYGGGLRSNLTNILRDGIGLMVGYSSRENYVNLACNGVDPGPGLSCDGPPEDGIIGKLSEFINELPRIGDSAGITRCEDVPSSGSVTGTDDSGSSVTVYFEQPTHSIPAGWLNAGRAFTHRVQFAVTVTGIGNPQPATIAYEFDCGHEQQQAAYAAVVMPMDNVPGFRRNIAVYNGPVDASNNGIQLFMAEHDPNDATKIRTGDAVDIRYDRQTLHFGLWGTLQGHVDIPNNSRNVTMKVIAAGDYSAGKALVQNRAIAWNSAQNDNTNTLDPAVLSLQGAASDQLEADPQDSDESSDLANEPAFTGSSFGSPGMLVKEGCVDFGSPDVSLASNDASCAGFTLSSPADGAPALDANGSFSIDWTYTQMTSVLESF